MRWNGLFTKGEGAFQRLGLEVDQFELVSFWALISSADLFAAATSSDSVPLLLFLCVDLDLSFFFFFEKRLLKKTTTTGMKKKRLVVFFHTCGSFFTP